MNKKLQVELTSPDAKVPYYATKDSSGLDLHSTTEITLSPLQRAIIPTDIKLSLPHGYELQVRPRSGLFSKHGIMAVFGTVDNDYTGKVGVMLINLGQEDFKIQKGDRIAQAVIAPIEQFDVEVVDEITKQTERGEGGFGSTSIK